MTSSTDTTDPQLLLSPKSAAKLLDLSERSLERLRVAGEIKSFVVCNRLRRYSRRDLETWIERRLASVEGGRE